MNVLLALALFVGPAIAGLLVVLGDLAARTPPPAAILRVAARLRAGQPPVRAAIRERI